MAFVVYSLLLGRFRRSCAAFSGLGASSDFGSSIILEAASVLACQRPYGFE